MEDHSRRDVLRALSVAAPAVAGLGVVNASIGTPSAFAVSAELEPALRLAQALSENAEVVCREVAGLGPLENERALFFLLSAYDLATEMWFQKGIPQRRY